MIDTRISALTEAPRNGREESDEALVLCTGEP